MEELTTTTGSLEFGVAVEGFTTFMVRPWRMVQLIATEEMIYPLTVLVCRCNAFIQFVHNVANIFDQLGVQPVRKCEGLLWA
jgi:hypothetical protein